MTRTRNRNANRNESTSNQEPAGPRRDAPVRQTAEDVAHERAARPNARTGTHDDTEQERRPNAGTARGADTGPTDNARTRRAASGEDTTARASEQSTAVSVQTEQRSLGGVNERNAFESYGAAMTTSTITGTLIKFTKGDWVTGDDEDLEENTELVANMDQLMVGWIKWVDQRPAEQIMGTVVSGYQAPRRNELGDTNQSEWEVDDQGRPRDPWQFSNYIVMKTPGEDASEEHLFTYATSSKGGLGAIGALCRDFGKEMRVRPTQFPIVRLGSDSYRHPEYGRTYVPLIKIVRWEEKSEFESVTAPSSEEPQAATQAATPRAAEAPQAAQGRSRRRSA